MRNNKIFGVLAGFLILKLSVFGLEVKEIVAFGDSLSCNGNACKHADNPSKMCALYPQGKFTDGDVWLEILADKMGLVRPTPSLIGGTNFAYGGATTGWKHSKNRLNVGSQIDAYLKRTGRRADAGRLYVIWAGGNDIKNEIFPGKLISNMEAHIEALAHAGARQFLVPNFPPVESTPTVKGIINMAGAGLGFLTEVFGVIDDREELAQGVRSVVGGGLQETIKHYNTQLERVLVKMEKKHNVKIHRFDAYSYFKFINNDLSQHGIKDEFDLYHIDGFHPSQQGHELIAKAVYEELRKKY